MSLSDFHRIEVEEALAPLRGDPRLTFLDTAEWMRVAPERVRGWWTASNGQTKGLVGLGVYWLVVIAAIAAVSIWRARHGG